jgi:hypothetical protein
VLGREADDDVVAGDGAVDGEEDGKGGRVERGEEGVSVAPVTGIHTECQLSLLVARWASGRSSSCSSREGACLRAEGNGERVARWAAVRATQIVS